MIPVSSLLTRALLSTSLLLTSQIAFANFNQHLTLGQYTATVVDLTPDDDLVAGYTTTHQSQQMELRYHAGQKEQFASATERGYFQGDELVLDGGHGSTAAATTGRFSEVVMTNDTRTSFAGRGVTMRAAFFDFASFLLNPYTAVVVNIPYTYNWSSSGVTEWDGLTYDVRRRVSVSVATATAAYEDWSVWDKAYPDTGELSGFLSITLVNNGYRETGDFLDFRASIELEPEMISVPVPEPATWGMWAAGLLFIAATLRRRVLTTASTNASPK